MAQCLCRYQSDHHAAYQAGSGSSRNRIDISQPHSSVSKRALYQWRKSFDMRSRSDLRHDSAKGPMLGLLPGKPVGKHHSVTRDERGGCLIAA